MHRSSRYKVKDYRFGLQAVTLRRKTGLTQEEMASRVGVSEKAIRNWESGTSYPSVFHLRKLIEIYLQRGTFTCGHERDEAQTLWEQARENGSHATGLFDERWFAALLSHQPDDQSAPPAQPAEQLDVFLPPGASETLLGPDPAPTADLPSLAGASRLHLADWGEALDGSCFYGRDDELRELQRWVLSDQCRVVAVLGMGGMGKTALALKLAQQVAPHFDCVLWRSLRNAPSVEEIVLDCLQLFAEQDYTALPQSLDRCLPLLIKLLQQRRCLLVLDNVDTLLRTGDLVGPYLEGYAGYGTLMRQLAQARHQSCLLLTSREMPGELAPLEGRRAQVRRLRVTGLGETASRALLADKAIFGAQDAWRELVRRYAGNPLALQIVAEVVHELFAGDLAAFLGEGYLLFNSLLELLDEQFERLSALEQEVMYWLVIERDWVSLEELQADLIPAVPKKELLEALTSLRRRCLVERGERAGVFTLQPVLLEYVTERLVEHLRAEIITARPALLGKCALMKGQAKEYIRHSQRCLLLQPLLDRLLAYFGSQQRLEHQLLRLLARLRQQPEAQQGYSGGNLVNLLAGLKGHVRGADFAQLTVLK